MIFFYFLKHKYDMNVTFFKKNYMNVYKLHFYLVDYNLLILIEIELKLIILKIFSIRVKQQ
ncbi:hypothetical protein MtrunA17_Chr4g0050691 [Medicago truncatula]|uniref:Transmembrane protein n=1 Tax=Medicago truncatula TaxID=3880 RepID=A0A396IAX8_MEDTR|nr:hypothetical protein MtrunA17_Chr4g0050691 [Medicago truncatula]